MKHSHSPQKKATRGEISSLQVTSPYIPALPAYSLAGCVLCTGGSGHGSSDAACMVQLPVSKPLNDHEQVCPADTYQLTSAPAFHSPGILARIPAPSILWLQEMASRLQRLKKILQKRKATLKAAFRDFAHVELNVARI